MEELLGSVETFNGETLAGWARSAAGAGRPVGVDIYVDGRLTASVPANEASGADSTSGDSSSTTPVAGAFRFTFSPPLSDPGQPLDISRCPRLRVHWEGTDRPVPVVRDLRGAINVDDFGVGESLLLFTDFGFLPVPEPKLRAHVAGEGVTPASYRAVGLYVVLDLMHLGLLWPNSRVVDLGCGCGRVAAHLAQVVNAKGRYWGFDTWTAGIDWATRHITSAFPNATFHTVGETKRGKDPGYVGDQAYRLPLDAGACDVVLCASLFTHLTFDAALSYLREIRRVLARGGRAYVSCFVFDAEAEGLLAERKMTRDERGAYFQQSGFFDSYFPMSTFNDLFAQAELAPVIFRKGHWRGEKYSVRRPIGYQDLFVLRAP
ncbi:MAG: class I SAM-dependent methyltransferase [Thermoanaerobaculia bacterium]